jgi:hypothetical protein
MGIRTETALFIFEKLYRIALILISGLPEFRGLLTVVYNPLVLIKPALPGKVGK